MTDEAQIGDAYLKGVRMDTWEKSIPTEKSFKGKGKEIPPQDALARQRQRPYLRLIIMETVTTEDKVWRS